MTIIRRLLHWLELDHSPSLQMMGICPCKSCGASRAREWGDSKPRPNWFSEGFEGLSEEMVWQNKVEASSNGLGWVRAKEPEE
jgi:hypothetical protein